jgi:hypothetical protein
VITSVTFRTFPDTPVTIAKLNVKAYEQNSTFWHAIEVLLSCVPIFVDSGIAVQAYGIPYFPGGGASLSIEVYLINETQSAVDRLRWLRSRLESLAVEVQFSETKFDRLSEFQAAPKGIEQAGVGLLTASRFLSRELLTQFEGPRKTAHTLSKLGYTLGDILSIAAVAGGQVNRNKDAVDSAVHPDWRSALVSLTLGRSLPVPPNPEVYQAVQNELGHFQIPWLESLEDGQRGGYLGEPYAYERKPARTFWGENYHRLQEIKRRWDPHDIFITRLGVGSERWDDEGQCRSWPSVAWIETILHRGFSYTAIRSGA